MPRSLRRREGIREAAAAVAAAAGVAIEHIAKSQIRKEDVVAKKDAVTAFQAFVETYQVKYDRAADSPTKDRDALLAFYDFPAEHWKHLRTTNPVESTF